MKSVGELLGYQIHDDYGVYPENLFSWMVFRTKDGAENFIKYNQLKGFGIHEYYDGDIEDPTFIETRFFHKGEQVFNCEPSIADSDLRGWATVCKDTMVIYGDQIVLLDMENGGENESDAECIYQIAEGKTCTKCGGPICVEHNEELGYPYYCPECDENFYDCELK